MSDVRGAAAFYRDMAVFAASMLALLGPFRSRERNGAYTGSQQLLKGLEAKLRFDAGDHLCLRRFFSLPFVSN